MLTDKEKTELKSLDAKAKHDAHAEQCQRIYRAVNDGTLDRATVNDALERLEAMAGDDPDEVSKTTTTDAPTGAGYIAPPAPFAPTTGPTPTPIDAQNPAV